MFKLSANNLQYVSSMTFLLTTYSKYTKVSQHTFTCGSVVVTPTTLRRLAKRQVCVHPLNQQPIQWLSFAVYPVVLALIQICKLFAGGLHTWRKPSQDVIHGWVW